jgi:MFS family permease
MAGAPQSPAPVGRFRRRARSAVVDTSALRQAPAFRLMWSGQVISEFGRQVVIIAMPFQVYVRTGSTLSIGLLALVELVSILGLSLPAGAVADSMDRRKVLMATQGAMVLSTLLLLGTAVVPDSPVLLIYVAAFGFSAASSLDRPARKAALYGMVPKPLLNSAVGVDQASIQLASVCGPAVAGLVIGTLGLPAAYAFAVAGFLWMIFVVFRLGDRIAATAGSLRRIQGIREGLRFVRNRPVILSTMAIDFTAMVFGFPSALFPVLALSVFNVGAPGLGLIAAAPAAGALVASLLSGVFTQIRRKGIGVVVFVCLWGAAITAFGLSTFSFPLALVFLSIAGACDVGAAVLRASIVQGNTPDEMRGRVVSINLLAVNSGPRLGDLEASFVASLTSAAFSIASGGILCIVGTLLVARRFRQLLVYVDPNVPGSATAPAAAPS